jgi:hypothetical protein
MTNTITPLDKTSDTTMVITSCGRFKLLRATLESFFKYNDYPLNSILIIEDSGDKNIHAALKKAFPQIEFDIILNQERLGQMRSLDKVYARVKTPYIFHCEDDWRFTGPNIIEKSKLLLEHFPKASMVLSRHKNCTNKLSLKLPEEEISGAKYRKIDPECHPDWFGFSFNPGLRRLADYHVIGSYTQNKDETTISRWYKNQGYFMLIMTEGGAIHLGGRSHVGDPHLPKQKRNLYTRLKDSYLKRCKKIKNLISKKAV